MSEKISNPGMLSERMEIIKEINKYADSYMPEEDIYCEIINGISKSIDVPLSWEFS